MLKLIQENPDDHLQFMINYMEESFGDRATAGDASLINQLTAKVSELESKLASQNDAEENKKEEAAPKSDAGSENETDEDEEDDYMEDLPAPIQNKRKGPRASVSAESFGTWNKKADFKAKVVEKSEDSKNKIREKLS